jgi:tyrosyl-tRNA synthetase
MPDDANTPANPAALDPAALELLFRGCEAIYSREELTRKLERAAASGKKLRIKLGMDPTAPDVHLGHSVVLRKMRQFQDLGHTAVLIIGDYTARIGDPTGRDTTRPILGEDQIHANAQTYVQQVTQILDDSPGKLEVRFNSEWLAKLSFADVLKLTGLITVQQMLHRENFRKRMAADTEIMVSEFMYPLMQGYDSVAIHSDVELGGTDQTFNNLVGRDLMAKFGLEKQVVLVMPILVGLDGSEKMSKSKGNYVGLADVPNDMFGKVMSIPDALMPNYFTLLTDLPVDRIRSLTDPAQTHPREAKDALARIIVEQFHDRSAANAASTEFKARFAGGALPSDLETRTVSESPLGILNLIVAVGFAPSNSEARRLVTQGAVTFDDAKITDVKATVDIPASGGILKVGKRKVCRVVRG